MTSRTQWYNYCGFIDLEATEDNKPVFDNEEEAEDIDEQLEEYTSAITERAKKHQQIEIDSSSNGFDSVESLWVVGSSGPLWRVCIKKHTQDHLVSRLKQYKTTNHCLIAAFALPLVPQWVYLDCHHVNTALRQLLSLSFAVITSNGTPILEEVPVEEEASIWTMQQGQPKPQKGDWVVIPAGPYCRDVGCVHQIHDWGTEVLIVPHFYSHEYRRCPQNYEANMLSDTDPEPTPGYPGHSIVGDIVEVTGNRSGVMCTVNPTGLAIDLDNSAGIHHFPFCHMVKTILVGNFILCLESGHEGLVQVVEDFNIVVLAKGANKEIEDYRNYVKVKFALNANSIGKCVVVRGYGLTLRGKAGVVTDVKSEEGCPIAVVVLDDEPEIPHAFCPHDLTIEGWGEQLDIGQTSNALEQIKGPIKSSGQTPWIGVQVGIFQLEHLLRTKIGTIRDVICGQDNPSGLCLIIILETYDPATTNKEHTVDYKHVLAVESFIDSCYKEHMERFSRTGDFIRDRVMTPPVPLNPLNLAWDPHSKTPPLPSISSSHQVSYEHHGHWATDRPLLGKKKIEVVSPESVEPMHPATPCNHEYWIVIKGWHTGKYVHSICYEKGAMPKLLIWWMVAMVAPVEGKVDEQTGEELQLESTDLCLEDETDASKDINMLFSRKL
ncbi:hypothetical protein EDD85DRAFT_791787 [Armillaria nabsnona]|nr:hypothetical protein EDD85DRAFT_791787 [Armillaria nabsnona]